MKTPDPAEPADITKAGLLVFAALFGTVVLALVLGAYDDTTRLAPTHDALRQACTVAGLLAALVAGIVLFRQFRGWGGWFQIGIAISAAFFMFWGVSLSGTEIVNLVAARIDFPADETRSFQSAIPIAAAYATHGKGGEHWHV